MLHKRVSPRIGIYLNPNYAVESEFTALGIINIGLAENIRLSENINCAKGYLTG